MPQPHRCTLHATLARPAATERRQDPLTPTHPPSAPLPGQNPGSCGDPEGGAYGRGRPCTCPCSCGGRADATNRKQPYALPPELAEALEQPLCEYVDQHSMPAWKIDLYEG